MVECSEEKRVEICQTALMELEHAQDERSHGLS
jgi:hypothetical protein